MTKRTSVRNRRLTSTPASLAELGGWWGVPQPILRKPRRLKFESLEPRQVLSVTPIPLANASASAQASSTLDWEIDSAFAKAADLSRYSQQLLDTTTQWIVMAADGANASNLESLPGITVHGETGLLEGTYIVGVESGTPSDLIASLGTSDAVKYFYPLTASEFLIQSRAIPNDPLLPNQWGLINFGQQVGNPDFQFIYGKVDEDLNIEDAWEEFTGQGVVIGIVDTGVQIDHPDLIDNIRADLGFNAVTGVNNGDANTSFAENAHGTSVAGIAAGVGNNGIGITGVAYEAGIAPIRLIDQPFTELQAAQALFFRPQDIDIYNNSWGPPDIGVLSATGPLTQLALRNSVFFGRGGLGTIHVWAAGNGATGGTDSSNWDGFANSRYTIAVGGVDHDGVPANIDGTITSYPELAANVLLVAPTGSNSLTISRDTGLGSGVFSTDFTGEPGFNQSPNLQTGFQLDNDYLEDIDYTSRFNGTSAASPFVSGVIALMLEANPDLSYRDVQYILAASARQANPFDESWLVNAVDFYVEPIPGDMWPPQARTSELKLTNGAGFSVSYGRILGEYGYAHGVVDASLAVDMARNFQSFGDQRSELTYLVGSVISPVQAGITVGDANIFIPGGLSPMGIDEAFYEDNFPITDGDPPEEPAMASNRGQSIIPFSIPDVNTMAVEWIEVDVTTDIEFSNLRIALRSPDGTVSEMTHWWLSEPNNPHDTRFMPIGSNNIGGANDFTLSTVRHLGERSDIDPTFPFDPMDPTFQGQWAIIIENYTQDAGNIVATITVHGEAIQGTGRIQGVVGVDANGDGQFHGATSYFDPATGFLVDPATGGFLTGQITGAAITQVTAGTPFPIFEELPDPEPYASRVIVYVDLDQDGVRDTHEPFKMVGADGNYYFDLDPGTYDIRIDTTMLPEGLDNIANMGMGAITATINERGERVNAEDFADLNMVLLPNDTSMPESFDVSGVVFVDFNSNGIFDGADAFIEGAAVYADMNQNGVYEPGADPVAITDVGGAYTLADLQSPFNLPTSGYYTIGVVPESTFPLADPTNTLDGTLRLFLRPGDVETNVNFGFRGDGPAGTTGALSGVVFIDSDRDGIRDEGEQGVNGVTVFIDADGSGSLTPGDPQTDTAATGGYLFTNLAPGLHVVSIVTPAGFELLSPSQDEDGSHTVGIVAGFVSSGWNFGLRNLSDHDWGDLPNVYGATLAADNGARHGLSAFFLGSLNSQDLDGEQDGNPGDNADGDDTTTVDDENGIVMGTLLPGAVVDVIATASINGGYLQGWMDFNMDGDFNDPGERVFTNELLATGPNELTIAVPADLQSGTVYARFRYGEFGIDSINGAAEIGEVEDYAYVVTINQPIQAAAPQPIAGDFDGNGTVNLADRDLWRSTFGSTSDLRADGNKDGIVNSADFVIWRNNQGQSVPASGGGSSLAGGGAQHLPASSPVVYTGPGAAVQPLAPLSSAFFTQAPRSGVSARVVAETSAAAPTDGAADAGEQSALSLLFTVSTDRLALDSSDETLEATAAAATTDALDLVLALLDDDGPAEEEAVDVWATPAEVDHAALVVALDEQDHWRTL